MNSTTKFLWIAFTVILLFDGTIAARILALMTFPGKSHYINIQPIMQELALRGHEVTVVSAFAEKNPPPNYNQIIVDNRTFWDSFGKNLDKFHFETMPFWKEIPLVWNGAYFTTEVAFNSTSLQDFIKKDNSHYDLVFVELFYLESFYMFAHKYKAPIVAMCTMGFTQYLGEYMGNPVQVSYMPHEFFRTRGKLNLLDRLQNLYYTIYDLIGRRLVLLPRHQKLVEKHFSHLPQPLPNLHDLEKNVSLVLVNTHYSMDTVRPLVPGIVEIGGVHIKKEKPLPQDLQKYIDESKDGVILFSMGSNIKSNEMPDNKRKMFLNAFKKLKQNVLWKWEDENMPDKPKNVKISKWLPQTDILVNSDKWPQDFEINDPGNDRLNISAHPNVRMFITHGGLLSTIEAIHFGKPIIGIPVYGDQHLNTARTESMGIGLKLAFSNLSEEQISDAISRILENPEYSNTAKELSKRFRDRPNTPMDSAIFWIEYVIRHKGAVFMKSPLVHLEWYEAYMLDVAAIIILLIMIPVLLVRKIISCCCGAGSVKKSDKKRKNKNE